MDPAGAALPAWSWRDGQDTGGWPWDLQSTMPNVEDHEIFYPMLYLWRKEVLTPAAPGGSAGATAASGLVPHKTDRMVNLTVSSEVAVPGPVHLRRLPLLDQQVRVRHGRPDWDQMAAEGRMPRGADEVKGGDRRWVPAKSVRLPAHPRRRVDLRLVGGGGYGDPLERDPEAARPTSRPAG